MPAVPRSVLRRVQPWEPSRRGQ